MTIKKLPKHIAAKIAAGEVVERPASVVKELVENAIDAGATQISIRILEAGKRLIEVKDNGCGISENEINLALDRYATSKIATINDLENIRTLGFRGEALASIAAVSRMELLTRTVTADLGVRLQVEGGVISETSKTGIQIGTMIDVRDLFFNVPARLKFLKTDITERRNIYEVVSRYALCYPDIQFSLSYGDRSVFATGGNGNQKEIFSNIMDVSTAKQLLAFQHEDDYIKTSGLTSPLRITKSNRKYLIVFLNGRYIKDKTLSSAILQAYRGLLMIGRYPVTFLHVQIDPQEVDVNVHPTKSEVRLKDPNKVFRIIQRTIKRTIAAYSPTPVVPPSIWGKESYRHTIPGGENRGNYLNNNDVDSSRAKKNNGPITENENSPLPLEMLLLRVIGQLGAAYIAAEGPDGLYLIDQHAAHERVLFEKLKGSLSKNLQLILDPIIINLPQHQAEVLEKNLNNCESVGLKIEDFGPNAYKITAISDVLTNHDPKEILYSLIEGFEEISTPDNFLEAEQKEKLVTRICKGIAVKAGQILSKEEQGNLVRDLEKCENPRTCPHGRPTMIFIPVDHLDRQFGRKGSI